MSNTEDGDLSIENEAAERVRRAVNLGADISGQTFGAVAGFLMGGPVGAGFGAAAGTFLGRQLSALGAEVLGRHLSPREEKRVGAVIAAAAETMRSKLKLGQQLRSDEFLSSHGGNRCDADEIIEGVLIAAQREHEERKIPFMGRLLANIAFDASVDRAQANFLIRTAESLSYRALCLIFVASRASVLQLRETSYINFHEKQTPEFVSIITETYDLVSKGLINNGKHIAVDALGLTPREFRPQGVGHKLYQLMELESLSEHSSEWLYLARLFGSPFNKVI